MAPVAEYLLKNNFFMCPMQYFCGLSFRHTLKKVYQVPRMGPMVRGRRRERLPSDLCRRAAVLSSVELLVLRGSQKRYSRRAKATEETVVEGYHVVVDQWVSVRTPRRGI